MNGGQRAVELQELPDLFEGDVLLLADQVLYLQPELFSEVRLAPANMIPGGDVAGSLALGQELFHHTQRNVVTGGNFLTGSFPGIVRCQNPLTQIQR